MSSDASMMLLALAERCRKVADTLAAHIADRRDPLRITHTVADVLRARMLATALRAIPMADDFERGCAGMRPVELARRHGPPDTAVIFAVAADYLALGERADAAGDHPSYLCSGRYLASKLPKPPPSVVLDIDDTVDVVHGHQQLARMERPL